MMASTTFFIIFVALLFNLISAALIPEERAEDESERIIGGSDAAPGQFPWAAALYYNNRFICTSSIISDVGVMTAAHCVVDSIGRARRPGSYYAIANHNKSAPGYRIDFSRLVVHSRYNRRTVDNDVAIFTATRPIPQNAEVNKLCIAGPNTPPMQYRNATAMGWGNTSPVRVIVIIPEIIQHVEQTILPNLQCTALGAPSMTRQKICATGPLNGVCNGDSGGPLVHMSSDKVPVQVGVASYLNAMFGCGKISPAVYARVGAYHDWIMQNVADPANVCVV